MINHIEYRYGELWEVRCKGCGEPIRVMRPVDETPEGMLLKLVRRPNYRQVVIEMDDGSRHVTALCAKCVDGQNLDLDAVYAADVSRFADDGTPMSAHDAARVPVRIAGIENVEGG